MRHLLELFLFFIVLMGLPDWYIYRNFIKQWKPAWVRRLYWLPTILLLIGMIVVFYTYEPRPQAMNRLSLFLIVFLSITNTLFFADLILGITVSFCLLFFFNL